jgi:transcriptional regulator with XRE-family HTH domain
VAISRIEDVARQRLRSARLARGLTLDQLSQRSNIGASTISRIETGHRRLAIDMLADLARALDVTVDELLTPEGGDDVVIRPVAAEWRNGDVYWPLNRQHDPSGRIVSRLRIGASKRPPEPSVHPGHEWFYVIEGAARLVLGGREHLVLEGQAAEFDTMTPHWFAGFGGPVVILAIFDRGGERFHFGST